MSDGFIFWRRPLRVAGPRPPQEALARLRMLIQGRRFGVGLRLIGTIRGPDSAPALRLWRKGLLSAAGDVIEFRGTLRADGAGSAFEGELCYAFGTKFQFVGLLLVGAVLLFAGAVRELEGAARDTGMLGMGLVVAGVAAVWIYASSRTRSDQIRFIEEHLETCADGG
ncbi:MAG TPA: hypothetical protein VLX30_11405 [Burkholderiales bacterium]|nr:hypothetical protein [Burkholderiales bacterium]